ncbi:MAG: hypothetical protein QXG44_02915 [Candidatus Jordarchaeaceae archaeon]
MYKSKVFFVAFFAAIILGIGIGITTVQVYKLPEPNQLTLGMSMLVSSQKNNLADSLLDPEAIAKIENGSLTPQEIDELKKTLQDSINQGFREWQMQNIKNNSKYGSLMSQNNPDNETVKRNFFSFLKQNPMYLEQFKQYDQLLSREIELKMENITRRVHASFKDVDLIVQQGKLVYERNGTITIDGENCTTTVRVYELEINGTTQTATKISIYSPNGTIIADPYINIVANDLSYWTTVGWWQWVWWSPFPIWVEIPWRIIYGYDFLFYLRMPWEPPFEELQIYTYSLYNMLEQEALHWDVVVFLLSVISSFGIGYALAAAGITAGATIAGVASAVQSAGLGAMALGRPGKAYMEGIWKTYLSILTYNTAHDPSFGFELMTRFHCVNSPQLYPVLDPFSFITYNFVAYDGLVRQVAPEPGLVIPLHPNSVCFLFDYTLLLIQVFGLYKWVWFPLVLPPELVTPPEPIKTTFSLSGIPGREGWYASDVNVTLSAIDETLISKIEYSFDGANWFTYAEPFTITTEGITTIYYRLIDLLDLVLEEGNETIKIDKTVPNIEIGLSGTPGLYGWYASDLTITLSATDDVSGVAKVEYSYDELSWFTYAEPFTVKEEGVTTIYYRVTDVAGNVDYNCEAIMIDKTPPETKIGLVGILGQGDWYKSDLIVNLTSTDNLSGINKIEYSFDGVNWFAYTESFIITTEGVTILYYRTIDVAGNAEDTKTGIIMIDKTLPITELTIGTYFVDDAGNIYVTSTTKFTLTATDYVSGVAHTYYRINGGDWIEYIGAFNITGKVGTYTVEYYSVDVAGNKEPPNSETVILEEEFQGYGVIRIGRQWFNGEASLFRSENLIRVEVGEHLAFWNIVKQWENQCKNGSLEVYFGEGFLGRIVLIVYRGEISSHAFALGRGVSFHTCTQNICCL